MSLNRITNLFVIAFLLLQFSLGVLHSDEQAILANWYHSLQSKGTLNWNTANDLCAQSGAGVYCEGPNPQRVVELVLDSKQLNGTIPTQFGSLTSLQYLYLNNNQLSGPIPTQLASSITLRYLWLHSNPLSGTIPTQFGNLTNLQELTLNNNQLNGTIPSQLGSLTNLQKLDLYNNQLIGTIPAQLVSSTTLQWLYLRDNYWDCPIPNYFSKTSNDHLDTKAQCDSSCSLDQCKNGGQCSTRLNGNFNCDCLLGYHGPTCDTAFYCSLIPKEENAEWVQTLANGQTVNGNCINGYYGTVSRTCTQDGSNGNWGSISGSCDAVNCSYISNENNAEWAQTLANGQTVNGNCLGGYYGTTSRSCIQSGSNGNWDSISGSCNAVNCSYISNEGNAEWNETLANGQTIVGNCINGYYGSISRTCAQSGSNGNWGTIIGSCDAVYCSANLNEENANWGQTLANGDIVDGECLDSYYGTISRKCIQDGSIGNWSAIIGSCNDINECEINGGGCHSNAICTNTPGSFLCECKGGYEGDGFNCTDIDECLSGTNNCHAQANCINSIGSFSCSCKSGYQGGGVDCYDLDECLLDLDNCHAQANCNNIIGNFSCTCKEGYSGDGIVCDPISTISNEKSENNQAVGIGVGVGIGALTLFLLILLILFFLRKNKQKKTKTGGRKYFEEIRLDNLSNTQIGEMTLMNTKLEVSMPGFMKIDYLNQIRKEEKIGGGGCATIYKGVILDHLLRQKFESEEIAIKQIFDNQKFSDEENKIRFEQEVAIMWGISSHPNIITLIGYSDDPKCIITQLYKMDLFAFIKGHSEVIGSDIIMRIASNIASGMNMMNSAGIVHRDLKSSNVLLEEHKGELNAVICDFGLARAQDTKVQTQKVIDIKGFSPRYTAPEVFGRMMTNVTVVSVEDEMKGDVYSYSVILWEMMTRKIPWAHLKEESDIDFQVRSGKREAIPDAQGDSILELLSAIIELGWSQNPDERPTFKQITQKLSQIKTLL